MLPQGGSGDDFLIFPIPGRVRSQRGPEAGSTLALPQNLPRINREGARGLLWPLHALFGRQAPAQPAKVIAPGPSAASKAGCGQVPRGLACKGAAPPAPPDAPVPSQAVGAMEQRSPNLQLHSSGGGHAHHLHGPRGERHVRRARTLSGAQPWD